MNNNRWVLTVVLVFVQLFRQTAGALSFTSVNILINIAAPKNAGKANGIAFSLASLFRTVGPSVSTNILAWSITTPHSFPFNQFLVFEIISVIALLGGAVAASIGDIEQRHKV